MLSAGIHSAAFIGLHEHARMAARRLAAFDTTPQTLTGDTLEIEPGGAPQDPDDEDEVAETTPATAPSPAPATRSASAAGRKSRMRVTAAPADSETATGSTAVFGAAGVRFASDLATTFTRAFPQAASAEPLWTSIALGEAGTADVLLTIDDEGRLAASSIVGAPSVALHRSIERTLVLLAPRTFTAHAPLTKLRVRANVARDDVHDGLHGDVFALSGGSFSGEVGNAFFALPSATGSGRRVDVTVRLAP